MSEKIKFGLIGYGRIGKRHAKIISDNPDAELIAVCDVKPKESVSYDLGIPYFDNTGEFYHQGKDIDVVSIATPNYVHAAQAIEALEQKKNVVVEKPMALNKADGERILYKALQKNKLVFGVMQNRYSPPSVWLKELIDSGKLGKIFMVNINCYWNRDGRYYKTSDWKGSLEKDGGTLFTQFSHFIDIMYWVFGDIRDIRAQVYNFDHQNLTEFEDSGNATFRFVNGGIGTLSFSTSIWDKNFESSITVIAENGTVKVGGQYMNEVLYCHVKDYEMPTLAETSKPNNYGGFIGSAANHNFVFENVINVLKGHSTITTNAMEGLKVVEIIERIYEAAGQLNKLSLAKQFS